MIKICQINKCLIFDEFKKFVELYDFEKNIFNYARTFVVEGELAFENVIDPKESKKRYIVSKTS